MLKLEKKIIVTLVSIIILISGFSTISATSIKKDSSYSTQEETSSPTTKTVTVYRYGADGSITPVDVKIELKEGQDINEAIEEKCLQILTNDPEFKDLLNNSVTRSSMSFIKSRGRGLHLRFCLTITWLKKFDLFPLLPPYIFRRVNIPIIYCRYSLDQRAYTKITPLLDMTNTTTITGPHIVRSIGFYGFKWWLGHISLLGFGIRTGFVGFSLSTKIREL